MKPALNHEILILEARKFCLFLSETPQPNLYGVTDGKAVGTLVEQAFKQYLAGSYAFRIGSSANGIDLPDSHVLTDIKVTSIRTIGYSRGECLFCNDVVQWYYTTSSVANNFRR